MHWPTPQKGAKDLVPVPELPLREAHWKCPNSKQYSPSLVKLRKCPQQGRATSTWKCRSKEFSLGGVASKPARGGWALFPLPGAAQAQLQGAMGVSPIYDVATQHTSDPLIPGQRPQLEVWSKSLCSAQYSDSLAQWTQRGRATEWLSRCSDSTGCGVGRGELSVFVVLFSLCISIWKVSIDVL